MPGRTRPVSLRRFTAVAVLASVVACDFGSGPGPVPASLQVSGGDGQVGTVFKPVLTPPSVRVVGPKGKPLKGVEVVFSVVSGGGQVSGSVSLTDKEGVARVAAWILGTTAGPQILQALVEGLPPLIFNAVAEASDPAEIKAVGGDDQVGVVGTPVPVNPRVRVTDPFGNAVSSATVEFTVTGGGGILSEVTSTTDPDGTADSPPWTLGPVPGLNTLSAAISGLPEVHFRATSLPDVPSRVTVLLGDGQTGVVGAALPLRPAVLVADRFTNPLEGIPVHFRVASGGGTVAGGDPVTDPAGAAISGLWTLGPGVGVQTLTVTVDGVEPVVLSATAVAGPPASVLAQGPGAQTALVAQDVPDPPTVRVEDAFGNPVPGVEVQFLPAGSPDPQSSPGSVEGGETATDALGTAAVQRWTLGTVAGEYTLSAQVAGLSVSVEFFAVALPDSPAALSILNGDHQTAPAGEVLPVSPSVQVSDPYGNGVPEVPVVFGILEGGGVLTGAQVVTDGEGRATAGSWTLGPDPGANRVTATVDGIGFVTFQAVGLSAVPAQLTKVAGDGQTAPVGTALPVPPKVRVTDGSGNPVASVPVTFAVSSGGGSVTQAALETGPDGTAAVGAWTLGSVAGPNTLAASVEGLSPVSFSATGVPASPEAMELFGGEGQEVLVGSWLPVPPSVRVTDGFGNPVPHLTVTFTVLEGGGTAQGGSAETDQNGIATVGRWTLGPVPGLNRLSASAPSLPSLDFHAIGWPGGGFDLEVEFMTAVEAGQAQVFLEAAARWEGIIVGDIPDFGGTLPEGGCQPVTDSTGIDDVKIYVSVKTIDGAGGILGRAGPCYYRTLGGVFPITGIMELDEADLAYMQSAGFLDDVIVHEMGHILGIGTLWNAWSNQFLVGAGEADPYFVGAGARVAFDAAGGTARTAPKVPVENLGGVGTRDAHWRESVHDGELMTGWIEASGTPNPLSAITVASLADMGYVVNMNAADPYVLPNPLGAPSQKPSSDRIYIQELPPPIPIPVGGGQE